MAARRDRGETANKALLGLIPFFFSWSLITAYLALRPNILHNHLIPFVLYVGLINAYSVGQMITAVSTPSRQYWLDSSLTAFVASHEISVSIPKCSRPAASMGCCRCPRTAAPGEHRSWMAKRARRRCLPSGIYVHVSWLRIWRVREFRCGRDRRDLRLPGYLVLDDQASLDREDGWKEGKVKN